MTATLARAQRVLGQQHLALETRETLVLTAGNRFVSLPTQHVQTYALLRAAPALSASVRLRDNAGVTWWLTVSAAGVLDFTTTTPTGAQLLTSSAISWLRITSPDATLWYVYPATLGTIETSTVQPAGSGETNTIQLRDTTGTWWYLSVDNTGFVSASTSGSAVIAAAAITLHPLQRMEAEARQRLDNRAATGPPRHYAIEGKTLWVDPTPDATYEVEHLYFSTDETQARRAWDTVSVLDTVGTLLTWGTGSGVAAAQVREMSQMEKAMLQQLYVPGPRDARSSLLSIAR